MTHIKHTKLKKAARGLYGPLSISLIGAPCTVINALAQDILQNLPDLRAAYIDARHDVDDGRGNRTLPLSAMSITQHGNGFKIDTPHGLDPVQRNGLLNDRELVLVNGNHFDADHQILLIDERKPLEKKAEKITAPLLAVRQQPHDTLPKIPRKSVMLEKVPVYDRTDTPGIADSIRHLLSQRRPDVYGLVLAGGMSLRMGRDKGIIDYHGAPQRKYLYETLRRYTPGTFVSCRADQAQELENDYPLIVDTFTGLGPYGAILSAFREHPHKAWLVVACDLPLLRKDDIAKLLTERDVSRLATTFFNETTDFPEPLITIWEPRAYPTLLQFLSMGISCPRKVLINSDIKTIQPDDPQILENVNSPEAHARILKILESK